MKKSESPQMSMFDLRMKQANVEEVLQQDAT